MIHPADDFPVVISAMGGMLPGAPDMDAYWQRIRRAEVAPLTDLGHRWGLKRERYYSEKLGVPDRTYVDQGFCLPEDAGCAHSDLPDRQARIGQAVLRQCLGELQGSRPARIGFVLATEWAGPSWFERAAGLSLKDVAQLDLPALPAEGFSPERQLHAIAAGLTGPKMAVDTACASSFYGLDLAQRLLRSGRADAVAVMGLAAWLPPFLLTAFSQLMALSPVGRLLPYSANGSGIMLGEACGMVLVEPMTAALAAGRPILAVLRRQGLSADGADRSVFAPGRDGQRLIYRRAYRDFEPGTLDYLEGHGTATRVGDETELAIMQEFFGPHYSADKPLAIGSVKGLIGHTLAAAGMGSTLKALLMLQHRELPPHNKVTPHPALADSMLTLLTEPTPWLQQEARARRIGVSGFGFGGSNAHLVLEEYRARDWPSPRAAIRSWRPLAIVDIESSIRNSSAPRLPAELTIEADGLRMGPNFLKRLDPYQLLLTDLAHRLVQRQPELAGDESAGVVVGSNLGGALVVGLIRRNLWLTRHQVRNEDRGDEKRSEENGSHDANTFAAQVTARADQIGPKYSLECIASCLPNMCSGYPAFHFNLRGFHQTMSGGPGLFWEQLALAPEWLEKGGCERLLLGAGRMNKSVEEDGDEGAVLMLLQERENAKRPLGLLHAMIPAEAAPDFESACAMAGFSPAQFDWRGSSDLSSASAAMGEAAGVEVLMTALREAGHWAAIEIRADGKLQSTVFLEKLAAPNASNAPHQLPLTVSLRQASPPQVAVPASAEDVRNQPGRKFARPDTVFDAESGRDDTDVHAVRQKQEKREKARKQMLARLWLQSTTAAMHDFFAAQRAGLALLDHTRGSAAHAQLGYQDSAHAVLRAPARHADGSLHAGLLVDESHPYFFDHPLDHVPGILMLEGVLQLAHWGSSAPAGQESWVSSIQLRFRRFCEKSEAITLDLQPDGASQFNGLISQAGSVACKLKLHLGTAPAHPTPSMAVAASDLMHLRPDRKLLHKHRPENVMVSAIFDQADGSKAVQTFAPPAGHILAEGSPNYYGMLYLLEVTRQFVMLIAHTVWNVPLGLPMNLLSIQLDLDHPALRSQPLTISCRPGALGEHRDSAIVVVEAELYAGDQRIGRASIAAQGLSSQAYRQQRNSLGEPA
ncbi:hypothetical protein BH11PSE11_BH11PSE11_07520 [soil metagenome]